MGMQARYMVECPVPTAVRNENIMIKRTDAIRISIARLELLEGAVKYS